MVTELKDTQEERDRLKKAGFQYLCTGIDSQVSYIKLLALGAELNGREAVILTRNGVMNLWTKGWSG